MPPRVLRPLGKGGVSFGVVKKGRGGGGGKGRTEGLCGQDGGGVDVVDFGEVVEDGEVDGEDAHGAAADGEGGEDPVGAW